MEGAEKQAALTAARNQSLFRAINEQIDGINESFQVVLEDADYVCECAKNECMERIVMTLDDRSGRDLDPRYERIVLVFNGSNQATTQTVAPVAAPTGAESASRPLATTTSRARLPR